MNYDSQLKAWAVDRAIETLKQGNEGTISVDNVVSIANQYCEFTDSVKTEEEKSLEARKKALDIRDFKKSLDDKEEELNRCEA
jgi:hypothetical protein